MSSAYTINEIFGGIVQIVTQPFDQACFTIIVLHRNSNKKKTMFQPVS